MLPALGGGLTDLWRTGQVGRLLHYDLTAYTRAFPSVSYFSYFDEQLPQFTSDAWLLKNVWLYPNRPRVSPRLYALWLSWRYREALKRCRVLRVEQFPGVIPALIARALWGIPFVVTYGYDYDAVARSNGQRKHWRYAFLRRWALPRAAAVIVPNARLRSDLFQRWPRTRFVHLPNGVDTDRFTPLSGRGIFPSERVVIYVGRLSREKNLACLVGAVARLKKQLAVRLVFIGDGPERPALTQLADKQGVHAQFWGVVPYERLPGILAMADCFVLPSVTEGSPKALLEAMSCGVPCIAADGIDLIADGHTGLAFCPHDAGALADQIHRVLIDAELARHLSENGRAAVRERYEIHHLLDQEVRLVMEAAA